MSEERFVVRYDGPALDEHAMDVRDLAPSLLGLSDAFHRAQQVLTPGADPVNLKIKAFGAGSFEVSMLLTDAVGYFEFAMDALTSRPVHALGGLGVLTTSVFGTFRAVKWLGGRPVRAVTPRSNGMVELVAADGTTLEIPANDSKLLLDLDTREALATIVKPIGHDGVESLKIVDKRRIIVDIQEEDLPAFRVPEVPSEVLGTSERDAMLQLLGISFDDRKWRVTEGDKPFYATIEDPKFVTAIDRQEAIFGKNDLLKVRLKTTQRRTSSGTLKADYLVLKVIEHFDGGRQLPFDLEGF